MDLFSLQTDFTSLKQDTQNSKLEGALKIIVNMILDALPASIGQIFLANILSLLEDLTKKTDNKIDDIIVHALCNKARQILNLPEETESFNSNVSQYIKSNIDKYTPEIDFGTTDTMKAMKDDLSNSDLKRFL